MVRKRDGYGAITLWRKHDRALLYCHHVNPQLRTRHGVNAVSFLSYYPITDIPPLRHRRQIVAPSLHRLKSRQSDNYNVLTKPYLDSPYHTYV